jgi:hypothetical protein
MMVVLSFRPLLVPYRFPASLIWFPKRTKGFERVEKTLPPGGANLVPRGKRFVPTIHPRFFGACGWQVRTNAVPKGGGHGGSEFIPPTADVA